MASLATQSTWRMRAMTMMLVAVVLLTAVIFAAPAPAAKAETYYVWRNTYQFCNGGGCSFPCGLPAGSRQWRPNYIWRQYFCNSYDYCVPTSRTECRIGIISCVYC